MQPSTTCHCLQLNVIQGSHALTNKANHEAKVKACDHYVNNIVNNVSLSHQITKNGAKVDLLLEIVTE